MANNGVVQHFQNIVNDINSKTNNPHFSAILNMLRTTTRPGLEVQNLIFLIASYLDADTTNPFTPQEMTKITIIFNS